MKIRIDGTPEEIEQAAHIFGPSCGPIKLTKKRDGGNFGYLEVDERQKIICLDCETTGLDPNEDEILSLSIVDWDGNVLHDRKYKPTRKTEWPDAERVNGISSESVAECRGIWQDDGRIGQIICDADEIIGYNVGFDMSFLSAVNIGPYRPGRKPRITDTMYEFAKLQGDWDSAREDYKWYKLTEAARIAEYEWTDKAHGSLSDALACLAVQKYVDAEWRRLRGPEGIQMLYPNFRL